MTALARPAALALLALTAAAGCGGADDEAPRTTTTPAPRVLTSTTPKGIDPKEAFLIEADVACQRAEAALTYSSANPPAGEIIRKLRRAPGIAERSARRLRRQGIPKDLPAARRYHAALLTLADATRDASRAVRTGPADKAARAGARIDRAFARLARLSKRLRISGCRTPR